MRHKLVSVILLLFVLCGQSGAFPRFALRMGASCQSCHVNPTGGGMRNIYGVVYGQEKLPAKIWEQETEIENFSTQISEVIGIGADVRTLTVHQPAGDRTSFLETQADLYVHAKLNKKLSIYLNKGLTSNVEVFGLARVLPMKGYVKVGRFTPAYGIRLADRNNRAEDTGFEFGVAPGIFTFSSGLFNGSGGDKKKVFAARAEARLEFGGIRTSIGGSHLQRPSATTDFRMQSVFGGVSYSDLTVFGEVDFRRDRSSAGEFNGILMYLETDYRITQGVDLKFAWDYYDPDVDLKTGSFSSYLVGIEFFLIPGFEITPLYRLQKEEPTDLENDEIHLLFHFYL